MQLSEYETTMVLKPNIGGDAVEANLDRVRNAVSSLGGKLLAINHWGKKRLAYDIEKNNRGIYVHTQYLGGGSVVSEIERNLRLSEDVMRYLTVCLGKNVNADERQEVVYVKPDYNKVVAETVQEEEYERHDDFERRYDRHDDDNGDYGDREDG